MKRSDHDSVTCLNPLVIVHDCKLKVDGISKYLDNQSFEFDHTFHEEDTTESLYVSAGRFSTFCFCFEFSVLKSCQTLMVLVEFVHLMIVLCHQPCLFVHQSSFNLSRYSSLTRLQFRIWSIS